MLVTQTEFLRWWKMYYHPPTCCETIPFYNLFPSCCETIRWCVTWTGQYRFPIKVSFCRNRSVIAQFADQKYFGTIRDVEILIFPKTWIFPQSVYLLRQKNLICLRLYLYLFTANMLNLPWIQTLYRYLYLYLDLRRAKMVLKDACIFLGFWFWSIPDHFDPFGQIETSKTDRLTSLPLFTIVSRNREKEHNKFFFTIFIFFYPKPIVWSCCPFHNCVSE